MAGGTNSSGGMDGDAFAAEILGRPVTEADLPPPDTKRWVIGRKATVVAAVQSGLLGLEEACRRYDISLEEFTSWVRLLERDGMRALRVTRLQKYRERPRRRPEPAALEQRLVWHRSS